LSYFSPHQKNKKKPLKLWCKFPSQNSNLLLFKKFFSIPRIKVTESSLLLLSKIVSALVLTIKRLFVPEVSSCKKGDSVNCANDNKAGIRFFYIHKEYIKSSASIKWFQLYFSVIAIAQSHSFGWILFAFPCLLWLGNIYWTDELSKSKPNSFRKQKKYLLIYCWKEIVIYGKCWVLLFFWLSTFYFESYFRWLIKLAIFDQKLCDEQLFFRSLPQRSGS